MPQVGCKASTTFIMTQSGGSEGIGFAIPSKIARQVYMQLKTEGHGHRARLGLVAQSITPIMIDGLDLQVDHGVIVSDVDAEGPSATAGIKQDDVITAISVLTGISKRSAPRRMRNMTFAPGFSLYTFA